MAHVVIGITGRKYSGKDTLGNYLVDRHNYVRIAFADALKEAVKNIFDFNDEQLHGNKKEDIDLFWDVSPRTVLQFVGTELFRQKIGDILPGVGEDIWCKVVERKILNARQANPDVKYVITDVRYPNEVDMVKRLGGVIIKLNRTITSTSADNHVSEAMIDELTTDYLFYNNGSRNELFELFEHNINDIIA